MAVFAMLAKERRLVIRDLSKLEVVADTSSDEDDDSQEEVLETVN